MLTIQFDHSQEHLSGVLGITKEQLKRTKAAMIFGILNLKVFASQLFDDESEIPDNMKTTSGSLEAVLNILESDAEKIFTLLNFLHLHEKLTSGWQLASGKINLDELLEDEKDGLKKAVKMMAIQLQIKPVQHLIDMVKDANGNFDSFYNEIKSSLEKAESMGGLTDLFNHDDDDDE